MYGHQIFTDDAIANNVEIKVDDIVIPIKYSINNIASNYDFCHIFHVINRVRPPKSERRSK